MKERYLLEEEVGENGFSLITDYDGNDEHVFDVNIKSGDILPVLPLRNMVLFPGVFLPITVGRKASLKLVREAEKKHKDIAVICRDRHTRKTPNWKICTMSALSDELYGYWKCLTRQQQSSFRE